MRRMLYLFPVLSLLLTGCSALPYAHQIDKTALMEVLGVDGSGTGMVTVTAASGPRPESQDPLVLTAQAETISAACADMGGRGEDYVFFGDVEQVLVGEEAARAGLEPLLGHMVRDPELRLEAELWVVKGADASEVLLGAGKGESLPGRLSALSRNAHLLGGPRHQMARGALTDLLENGATLLPALERRAAEEGQGAQGAYVLEAAGYAVIRDGLLLGFTDEAATLGADLLRGLGKGRILERPGPEGGAVALKLTGVKTTFRTRFSGERLTTLVVNCALETQVMEEAGSAARLGEEDRRRLETELAGLAEEAVRAALDCFQGLEADAIHLLDRVALAVPWKKAALEEHWREVFPDLALEVRAEAAVAREQ